MLLIPDASTAILDPFTAEPTISLALRDHRPDHAASRTARTRAGSRRSAEEYLRSTGIADTAYFGPESEFFVFDDVAYELTVEPRLLRGRLGRGLLELGRARPRLHDAARRRATSRLAARHAAATCAPRWS